MKKHMFLFFLVIVLLMSISVTTFALEKTYNTKSVHFEVTLNDDGSANVTETWVVDYLQGQFSRFYKNIYTKPPKVEQFDIEFTGASVDGEPCMYVPDAQNRTNNTYTIKGEHDKLRYEIYKHSENQQRTFQISYTLHNVIKKIDRKYYAFVYRFLPVGYKDTITDFSITIQVPSSDINTEVLSVTKGTVDSFGDKVIIKADNVNNIYKVKMKMDNCEFNITDKKSFLSKRDLNASKDGESRIYPVPIIICVLILFFIIKDKIFTISTMIKLDKNPTLLNDILEKWRSKNYSLLEFMYLVYANPYLILFVYLAEMHRKGIITIDIEARTVKHPIKWKNKEYDNYLKLLDQFIKTAQSNSMKFEEKNGYYILPLDTIHELPPPI